MLADVGTLTGEERGQLREWMEGGGVLVRFSGPYLAESADDLVPVPLRRGGRYFGGALSWDTAQRPAPFPDASPSAGPLVRTHG